MEKQLEMLLEELRATNARMDALEKQLNKPANQVKDTAADIVSGTANIAGKAVGDVVDLAGNTVKGVADVAVGVLNGLANILRR